jgi:putative DNA primase/helicase
MVEVTDIVDGMGLDDPPGPVVPRQRVRFEQSDAAVEQRKAEAKARQVPRKPRREMVAPPSSTPSEDAIALAFVERHAEHLFVAKLNRWLRWDGVRWREDSTGRVYECIRLLVRKEVEGGKAERATANAGFIGGVERLLRTDQRIVVLPEDMDADPWVLNTHSGIVDLRTGKISPHDTAALCARITAATGGPSQGADLWSLFLHGITQGDKELQDYLQRVAGYFATGVTAEDVLVYPFGIGANGKSSFAEAIAHVLGDYAKIFGAEVLMEAKGERHPTELAQFMGVRFALTSEPASGAAWNDSRIKSLTGDADISARLMRGDMFTFPRTHKTMVLGNHLPRLSDVTHAIRRRVQVVPFRAVFEQTPPPGMRERLKNEAGGAILAWIIEGARMWLATGTAPPAAVRDSTAEYLSDQDVIGQWLDERCERDARSFEGSAALHKNYAAWCDGQGLRAESNAMLSGHLVSCGFLKDKTMFGKVFRGLKLRQA